jgi:stress response protein SCP2
MFVTVNIATDNCTFQNVTDAFVRVCSAKKNKVFEPEHVLAEYPLDGYIKTRGLVFCRFIRNGDSWTMQALGWGCGGASASEDECLFVC